MTEKEIVVVLAPVSDENPCGPDISETAAHGDIDLAYSQLVAENQASIVGKDSETRPLGEMLAQWKDLKSQIEGYFAESKNLSISAVYVVCLLRLEGIAGFKAGLKVVDFLISRHWDLVHPVSDDAGETMEERIACLGILKDNPFLKILRETQLFSGGAVRTNFKEALEACASLESSQGVRSSFANVPVEKQGELIEDLSGVIDGLSAIESKVNARAEAITGFQPRLRFGETLKWLEMARQLLPKLLSVNSEEPSGDGDSNPLESTMAGPRTGVRSRADARSALDEVCRYYDAHEPGSPIPHLLKRARRVIDMDFKEICAEFGLNNGSNLDTLFGRGSGRDESRGGTTIL